MTVAKIKQMMSEANNRKAFFTINQCQTNILKLNLLFPRRKNDTNNPRGGVRGVIKDKQNYK